MTSIFLKAKHWQLFTVLIGIPLLLHFYIYYRFFWNISPPVESSLDNRGFTQVLNEEFIQFDYSPYFMVFFLLLFFGWFWSMGIGLQKKIPSDIKMKTKKFKLFFFIPLIYIVFLMTFISWIFPGWSQNVFLNGGTIVAIIIPFHLLSMFGIFYSLYFVAKTIKTAELQRKVRFRDFAVEFFLLWFYFIGIWIIQPKVNTLYSK